MAKNIFILFKSDRVIGTFSSEKKALKYAEYVIQEEYTNRSDYKSHEIEDADTFKVHSLESKEWAGMVEMKDYNVHFELMLTELDDYYECMIEEQNK